MFMMGAGASSSARPRMATATASPPGPPPPPPPPLKPMSTQMKIEIEGRSEGVEAEDKSDPAPEKVQERSAARGITSNTNADKNNSDNNESATHALNFEEALKKLDLPEHDVKSAKNIMKKNKDIHEELLNCVTAVVSMKAGNQHDTCVYVEKMNLDFFQVSIEKRVIIGDFLKVVTFPATSFQMYKQVLKDLGQTTLNESTLKQDDISNMIWLVRSHWWNFSDCTPSFGSSLITHGVIQEMVEDLKSLVGVDEKTIKISFTFESAIGALHNVAKIESHRQTFRDLKLVDILGHFLTYEKAPKITMLVLLTLALIIDESQTDLLFSHESSFDLLIRLATRAWKASDHRYDGFSLDELILGLKGLSKNDKVKRLLVDKGILFLVGNILADGKADEKETAAKLLWELSFDAKNKGLILDNGSIMESLKTISKSSGKISRSAQGVLWVLEMASKKKSKNESSISEQIDNKKSRKGDSRGSTTRRGHIMISYNWDDQKTLIQIKETLKEQGFKVWMDIDNISGSTLEAMAEAVEGSSVVLVCMSERYKESTNCRSEAEYAFSLNKPIIPLLMQERYKPDGWLGILLGTKLFFDFSGRFSFDGKLSELEKELSGRGMSVKAGVSSGDETDGPIVKESVPLVGKAPAKPKSQDMTEVEIKAWVLKHRLDKFPSFNDMEATHLSFLKKLTLKAPEFYYGFLLDLKRENKTMDDLNYLMQVTNAMGELPF